MPLPTLLRRRPEMTTCRPSWRNIAMLELALARALPRHIRDFDLDALANRIIVTGQHFYGCTAGSGSGCQGAIISS
jgi:hypothetical protein